MNLSSSSNKKMVNDGVDFELQVASFYKLMGFDVEHRVKFPGEEIDIVAKKMDKGLPITIMVECKDHARPVNKSEIAKFYNTASAHLGKNFTHAIFISRSGFVKTSYKEKYKSENKAINFLSYDEFISQLIDFKFLLREVVRDFENYDNFLNNKTSRLRPIINQYLRDDLFNKYIRLKGFVLYSKKLKESIDLTEYLLNSIKSTSSKIILVGEIGSGKTSICLYLNYLLAKSNINAKSVSSSLIPIYISLSHGLKSENIFYLIHNRLKNYGIDVGDSVLLSRILPQLPIVYFLDGFDEMYESNSQYTMEEIASKLDPIFSLDSPIILTSRSHYFSSSDQILALFKNLVQNQNELEIFEISPLTEEMVLNQIKKQRPKTWNNDWKIIQRLFNLEDLSKRPILLKMIIESLDQLYSEEPANDKGEIAIGPAKLYRTYTNTWLNSKISRSVIDTDLRHKFVLGLAELMWLSNEESLNYAKISEHIDEFKDRKEIRDIDILRLPYDALNCSFLIRTSEDKFAFSHKSFMEYFIAEIIAHEIHKQSFFISTKKRIDRAVSLYLRELIIPNDSDNLFILMSNKSPEGRINAHHIYRQLLRLKLIDPSKTIISKIQALIIKEDVPLVGAEIAVTLAFMGDLESQDNYLRQLYHNQLEDLHKIIKINIIDYYEATGSVSKSFRLRIENPNYEYARIWYLLSLGIIGDISDIDYLKSVKLINCREFEKEVIQNTIKVIEGKHKFEYENNLGK